MQLFSAEIPDVKVIIPRRLGDDRGWFCETWNRQALHGHGIDIDFVQDNQSYSAPRFTLRGLHFQTAPHAQSKLVRVLRGRIFDVAVDCRQGSPWFGRWCARELSAANGEQLLVPRGFAHGFLTLENDTEVAYKVDNHFSPQHDAGFRWDDPTVGVAWPLAGARPVLSPKDLTLPLLQDLTPPFRLGEPL